MLRAMLGTGADRAIRVDASDDALDGGVVGHFQATGVRPRFLGDLLAMGIKMPGSYFDPSQPL